MLDDRNGEKYGIEMLRKIYYYTKPIIPRSVQITARRLSISFKRRRVGDVWPIDPACAGRPPGWTGWPEGKRFALVLTHDVDTARGQDRCRKLMDIEKERGFISSFYFVARRYEVSKDLREHLTENGFGVGIHGLYHDGKKFLSHRIFSERAVQINRYLKEWDARGFSSPSMLRNLEWIHELDIDYDLSTFDTDPFEPQPEGAGTIFPFLVENSVNGSCYVELPYTLPQDFTLFILMRENNIDIWKQKLKWIAEQGGMALINIHPDYMDFSNRGNALEEYPGNMYTDLLDHLKEEYGGQYWNALSQDVAQFCRENHKRDSVKTQDGTGR